jgi:glucose-6-phosphate dehydrogenase assembly protein OpcA
MSSAAITPDRILKELAGLWVSLGKQGEPATGAGVLRACSMTLVVFAEESEDLAGLGETMAALMPEHPARTVIVRLRSDGERGMSDRVYAQCWMPFGQRRQICCEQIEITASDAALPDLAAVVLPLAVADLPVIAWCRSARLARLPEFWKIVEDAAKVVVDTAAFPDGAEALRYFAGISGRGPILGDLAWTRLTRWREALARIFDNRQYLARLGNRAAVRIGHGEGYQTSAWYMAGWIANALGEIPVTVERNTESLRVELENPELDVRIAREAARLVITAGEMSACMSLPEPTDYLLMREELSILRRDSTFEKALASAARLAYATGR